MITLIFESAIIIIITLLSMWVVLALYQLPLKVRSVIAFIVVLWAVFWVLRLHRTYGYELDQLDKQRQAPIERQDKPQLRRRSSHTQYEFVLLKG